MLVIRPIENQDQDIFIGMLDEFYHSDAVLHTIPYVNYENTFSEIVMNKQYMDGYLFEMDGIIVGFTTLAKTFSTEVGGLVVWIEELYIKPEYQSKGLGSQIFTFIEKEYPSVKRIRLEVEKDNQKAIALYERKGFCELEYAQMVKEF